MTLLLAEPILHNEKPIKPTAPVNLGIVLVGHNPSSELFVSLKQKKAREYGVEGILKRLFEKASDEDVINTIESFNINKTISGIVVQLPLPGHLNVDSILDSISPDKDVDALTDASPFTSPMVLAVKALLDEYKISLENKKLCVVGNGLLVGQPLARYLKVKGFEPVVVDETTPNIDDIILESDIVFAGTGEMHRINSHNTREGQIIFDCSGVDVDFEAVKGKCAAITPPKGAIGPLTVHYLLTNVLKVNK